MLVHQKQKYIFSDTPNLLKERNYQEHHYCNSTDFCNKEIMLGDEPSQNPNPDHDNHDGSSSQKFLSLSEFLFLLYIAIIITIHY